MTGHGNSQVECGIAPALFLPLAPFKLLGRDLAEEPLLQSSDRLRLHPRQNMRVHPQGERRVVVPQSVVPKPWTEGVRPSFRSA